MKIIAKNTLYLYLFVACTTFIVSCGRERSNSFNTTVSYISDTTVIQNDNRNDTVAIYFISFFDQDSVEIYVNGSFFSKQIISTDEMVGSAFLLKVGPYKKVKKIGVRINRKNTITFNCDKSNQLFLVNKIKNDTVRIKAVTSFPSFR